jgi:uncharacterized protein DUF3999
MRLHWPVLLLSIVAGSAYARSLQPDDFAFGMELKLEGENALYDVALPPAVYRSMTRADLGDLRVFNGADEVVPHILRLPVLPPPPARATHTPPMFPVYAVAGESADAVVMKVQRDSAGRIARVETRQKRQGKRGIVAYIVDASALTAPVAALEFEWSGTPVDFLGTVSLQASDDLTRWSDVVVGAGLASLRFGDEQLERRRVEFAPRRAKYFRVLWPADKPLPELPVIKFEEFASVAPPVRSWEKITTRAGTNAGEYRFSVPGKFSIDRIRVELLPATNRVVQAQFSSRERPEDPWSSRGGGSVYRLKFGTLVLDSPELVLSGAVGTEWLLQLTPAEGLENIAPVLELGWVPHRLVFVASGKGPFRLAYGAAVVGPLDGSLRGVLEEMERKPSPQATLSSAAVGPETRLGGPERLLPLAPGGWRTWALWAALIWAVGLLAWMAHRLWRSMAPPEDAKP